MKHFRLFISIIVVLAIVLCVWLTNTTGVSKGKGNNKQTLEELKRQSTVEVGVRQDEAEAMLTDVVRMLYAPTSEEDVDSALENLKNYCTENEYNTLKEEAVYNKSNIEIMETNVYYCSKQNSSDGRAREYVDVKVGNDDENTLYLLEFIINSDGKIMEHKVWVY